MKEIHIKQRNRLFTIYQNTVLILCALTFFLFIIWYIPENLLRNNTSSWITNVKYYSHSLMLVLSYILVLFFLGHFLTIIIQAAISRHSVIWLIVQQAVPLVAPVIVILLIKLFRGQLDDQIMDMLVGICSGVVSSIIVLVLDRKHRLVETLTKKLAWEYVKEDSCAAKLE